MTAAVDRRCWRHLLETLGFDQLLDRQAREEFYSGLEGVPPAFTTENCAATFGHIWENRRDIYLRGIANTFAALDRRFRSHDGFKIGSRLIIERALSDAGVGGATITGATPCGTWSGFFASWTAKAPARKA
ncbi:MAG: DUF4942 domain-containing protein [Sphingomonadales bacterium]|nr:DUF4942 domain-containing protein [Sphingomonadales bacterium]